MNQFHQTIPVFDQGGTVFDPVAIIAIKSVIYFTHFSMMDMSANDSVTVMGPRAFGEPSLESAEHRDHLVYPYFDPAAETGRIHPQPTTDAVAGVVGPQQHVVTEPADDRQPLSTELDRVALIAVRDHPAATVTAAVDELVGDVEQTKILKEMAEEGIVAAGRITDSHALPRPAKEMVQNGIVFGTPMP